MSTRKDNSSTRGDDRSGMPECFVRHISFVMNARKSQNHFSSEPPKKSTKSWIKLKRAKKHAKKQAKRFIEEIGDLSESEWKTALDARSVEVVEEKERRRRREEEEKEVILQERKERREKQRESMKSSPVGRRKRKKKILSPVKKLVGVEIPHDDVVTIDDDDDDDDGLPSSKVSLSDSVSTVIGTIGMSPMHLKDEHQSGAAVNEKEEIVVGEKIESLRRRKKERMGDDEISQERRRKRRKLMKEMGMEEDMIEDNVVNIESSK